MDRHRNDRRGEPRQKGKASKRPKHWHRGKSEAERWAAVNLPDVGSGADPTTGVPIPHRSIDRKHSRRRHGDTA